MEASTLQKKKHTLSKGKLKKTIKNVICRPDTVTWPVLTEEREAALNTTLFKLKINLPEFKKLPWSELKNIPKESRLKQPPPPNVKGLIFGINQCFNAVEKGSCAAIIIEALINPRLIVHSVLESCNKSNVPVVCLHNLRKTTSLNFGIPTSCLGVENSCVELKNKIIELEKTLTRTKPIKIEEENSELNLKMDVDENLIKDDKNEDGMDICPYLYRTNKKSRMFVPPSYSNTSKPTQKFSGQDFIELSDKCGKEQKRKDYMSMILKRISNNPNRKSKKS